MREPGEVVSAAFPRPGRALKVVLAVLATFALGTAIVLNWAPGGARGSALVHWLVMTPGAVLSRPWTLVTSALVTLGFSHALWSLVGLYFFAPDLEKSWGAARLVRFLVASVVFGNLAVLAFDAVPLSHGIFHPQAVCGPMAMIGAVTVAWAKENAGRQLRFMFFLPMSGKTLYWITIAFAVLAVVFAEQLPEGAVAPFGGIAAGILLGGSPSAIRSLWLRLRLGSLRRRGGGLDFDAIPGSGDRPRPTKRAGKGGPPLRVVYGGLEDDLKNRKPPKDKRYLN